MMGSIPYCQRLPLWWFLIYFKMLFYFVVCSVFPCVDMERPHRLYKKRDLFVLVLLCLANFTLGKFHSLVIKSFSQKIFFACN